MARDEEDLLAELNAGLRPGVDWKQGAITYLREVMAAGGPHEERYHLVKPFLGGPDYAPFWVDVFHFLDVLHAAQLAPGDLVVDVGCGPGWTVHWMAKLGFEVIGLDISTDLLEVAERRMASDPHPPYVGRPFAYELREHDIEAVPLGLDRPARMALFESTLHHFFDPVAALRNVRADLADDGIVAVIESAAPTPGSDADVRNAEIMEAYDTIERPYTRTQLLDVMEVAGLPYVSFLRPTNGLFDQTADGLAAVRRELSTSEDVNTLVASPTAEGIERLGHRPRTVAQIRAGWVPVDGVHPVEATPDGTRFRWSGPHALVRLGGPGRHRFEIGTTGLERRQQQVVRAVVDGAVVDQARLTARDPFAVLTVDGGEGRLVELHSDRGFSPCWTGGADSRLLSFTIAEPD